jgi:hypothetical protein
VIPSKEGGWAVKEEGKRRIEKEFDTKREAVRQATKEAKKENASVNVQRKTRKAEKRNSYNPNKRAPQQK